MIQGFGQEITEIPAFGHDITEVRAMGQLVWQKSIPDYLCFTALEAGQFTLNIPAAVTPTYLSYVEWSKNGRTWNHTDNTSEAVTIDVQVAQGDKVYWRGDARRWSTNMNTYSNFSSDCRFNVSGNILSLLYDDDFASHSGTTTWAYSYGSLFRNCVNLIDASALILPTGHLDGAALLGLFRDCTGLVHGAPLYAPNIPDSCCYWMYYGCTSMTEMPTIAATSMLKDNSDPANYGLYYAFYGCSNMEGEVKLNIVGDVGQQVLDGCFSNCSKITSADLAFNGALGKMALRGAFSGCTSLSHVKCLATSFYDDGTAANGSLYNWMNNVSSTGVFVQAEGIQWPQGKSGIPTGWVDIEKRTMPSGYKQVEYLQAVKPYPSNYNAAIVGTEIVLDPSQDTIEFAVWPRLDEDGYLINGGGSTAGEMPFANSSSPTSPTAKVGFFYTLYRVDSSTNLFSTFFTRENGDGTNRASGFSLDATNKVTDNPQTIRVECSATSSVMYLNGTQVASRSGYTVDTSDMTTMQAFVLAYNNKTYSWEHPFYYLKWWRGANLIADYVPCVRESDDEVGFYDFASQTFKTRYYTSSEPFTAGEEI